MASVTVTALKAFEHNGRLVAPGDPVECDPPVNALPLARQGLVSLSTRVHSTSKVILEIDGRKIAEAVVPYLTTRDLKAADHEPEPEPERPRQKRRYRRRDMKAEG